jgi:hypothetical protein
MREETKGQLELGRKEEKREGKRKERVGRAQLEKRGRKRIAFKCI